MMATFEIWANGADGTRIALLERVMQVDYARAVGRVGAWSLVLPGQDAPPLSAGTVVEIWRDGRLEMAGFIDTLVWAGQTRGEDWLVVSGQDGLALLDRRIVAYAAGSSQASKTGAADDVMKAIVRENLGGDATDTDRDLSALGFSVEEDASLGATVTRAFAWQTVLDTLGALSQESGVVFDVRPRLVGEGIGFEFITRPDYLGADRSEAGGSPTYFGPAFGNMEFARLEYEYRDEVTAVYAGGQGQEADRLIAATTRSPRGPWGRRERFVDARSEPGSDAVDSRAAAALEAGRARLRFSGELKDTPQTRYGVDWGYGDKVVGSYRGQQFAGPVVSVRVQKDETGKETIEARLEVEVDA